MNALLAIDSAVHAERRLTLREIDELHKARAAIAELIEAANVLSDKSLQRTKLTASVYTSHVMRLRTALRAVGGQS